MRTYSKLLIAVLFLAQPIACHAQDFSFIGRPAPEGATSILSHAPLADLDIGSPGALPGKLAAKMLAVSVGDSNLNVRGAQEIEIYRNTSPSVVIVESDAGHDMISRGSGSYIGSNQILTNAHVVGSNAVALIAFKPSREGVKVAPSNIIVAHVSQIDRNRDLALLSVNSVPAYVHPLALGSASELQVGADVYAIGHPSGEEWTFTRGLISQIRRDYDWKDKNGMHKADVIQTQTPINVGNSGGPLIGTSGNLLGVNSFKTRDSEGLNFAISIEEVAKFLKSPRTSPREKIACEPVQLYDGRNKENTGRIRQIDSNCDGKSDLAIVVPDDPSKPIQALFDTNYDGKIDTIVDDFNRDGLWDVSFYDSHFNGHIDVVGFHPDGQITASSYEKYDPSRVYAQYRGRQIVGTAK